MQFSNDYRTKHTEKMKIVQYRLGEELLPGIVTEIGIVGIGALLNSLNKPFQCRSLTNDDVAELKSLKDSQLRLTEGIPESRLKFGPCVSGFSKIICIGLNYRKHAAETNMEIPKYPIVFNKFNNTLTDFENDVPLGTEGEHFDYEVELGVVIGEKCKNVSIDKALSYVLGYCVANDLSCRDLQFKTSQWLLGKSLDHFLPLGKYLVTADEVGDPQKLELSCFLNGVIRQKSNTSDMIFTVAEIISFLSKHMTLEPGDLILTGTPSGVIMGLQDKKWLKPGDRVKVEIEKLGFTENRMV
ncbi:MAG TPA: fumarylacetoacetate hydrolase family protein [Puia sp.]|jgi:2-keto-4-pentenoate hydratase/2-oxohepta-3-ene-1,7-dioic acid hydratase in catechol pathway|nr:fumarylacetoacetate hydrolase family protein [Puia sp.]